MHSARAGSLLLSILLVACGREVTPPQRVALLESVHLDGVQASSGLYYTGTTVTLHVRAVDGDGVPAAGELLAFVPLHGTQLSSTTGTTDAVGVTGVEMLNVGDPFGVRVEAAGSGVAPLELTLRAEPPPEVRFDFDDVRLTEPEESFDLFAQVLDGEGELIIGSSVQFELTEAGVVRLAAGPTATGSYSGMLVAVVAEAEGTTLLVATHRSGAADTAHIEVAF